MSQTILYYLDFAAIGLKTNLSRIIEVFSLCRCMGIYLQYTVISLRIMNRSSQQKFPAHPIGYPEHGRPSIVPNEHDILCGRGVNIAQHAGNERFRALIQSRHDANYCHSYTTSEKRAVAEDIISHLQQLVPPGRFLKRPGRSKNSRGLEGPWEELSEKESIKKTCQALRDCNRQDRTGYANSVHVPQDVHFYEQLRSRTGMSNKQFAQLGAAKAKKDAEEAAELAGKRSRPLIEQTPSTTFASNWGSISPSVQNAAEWLKRQKTHQPDHYKTPMLHTTPTTVASSGGLIHDTSLLDSYNSRSSVAGSVHQESQQFSNISNHFNSGRPSSPVLDTGFTDPFKDEDFSSKPSVDGIGLSFPSNDLDPLQLASEASIAMEGGPKYQTSLLSDSAIHGSGNGLQPIMHHDSFLHSAGLDQDDFPLHVVDHEHHRHANRFLQSSFGDENDFRLNNSEQNMDFAAM